MMMSMILSVAILFGSILQGSESWVSPHFSSRSFRETSRLLAYPPFSGGGSYYAPQEWEDRQALPVSSSSFAPSAYDDYYHHQPTSTNNVFSSDDRRQGYRYNVDFSHPPPPRQQQQHDRAMRFWQDNHVQMADLPPYDSYYGSYQPMDDYSPRSATMMYSDYAQAPFEYSRPAPMMPDYNNGYDDSYSSYYYHRGDVDDAYPNRRLETNRRGPMMMPDHDPSNYNDDYSSAYYAQSQFDANVRLVADRRDYPYYSDRDAMMTMEQPRPVNFPMVPDQHATHPYSVDQHQDYPFDGHVHFVGNGNADYYYYNNAPHNDAYAANTMTTMMDHDGMDLYNPYYEPEFGPEQDMWYGDRYAYRNDFL